MLFAEWRLIFTEAADACVNMALDEATLTLVSEHRAPPTVRIYYWDTPCYTLGYLQSASALRSSAISRNADIKCVRRLTGGQACLHGGDISYSLIVSLMDTLIPSHVLGSYEHICSGVIEGLRVLGIDARYAPPTDVLVDGRLVATAAQARRQGVLLHQGTIALKPAGVREVPPACTRLTPLSDLIGGQLGFEQVAQALAMGFKRALGVDLSPSILFAKEKRLARQLLRDKYMQPEWNFMR
jgi:lipoate-protein ligase A